MARKKSKSNSKRNTTIITAIVVIILFVFTAGKVDLNKVDFSNPMSILSALDLSKENHPDYGALNELPDYKNGQSLVVTLNNNQPDFTSADLSLKKGAWQKFTDLDSLNRVGVANAMLHKSLMPTGERGDISKVYPSGWKQRKLDNGQWLYNRSHLIAYRFTGENDNWKNLFSGTEEMNQEEMTKYEEEVAQYLKSTNNHVRYQVTPYFKGDELVPRGVQMEAQSVGDNKLSYNVFIYNAQKGYTIDYLTGSSKKAN